MFLIQLLYHFQIILVVIRTASVWLHYFLPFGAGDSRIYDRGRFPSYCVTNPASVGHRHPTIQWSARLLFGELEQLFWDANLTMFILTVLDRHLSKSAQHSRGHARYFNRLRATFDDRERSKYSIQVCDFYRRKCIVLVKTMRIHALQVVYGNRACHWIQKPRSGLSIECFDLIIVRWEPIIITNRQFSFSVNIQSLYSL